MKFLAHKKQRPTVTQKTKSCNTDVTVSQPSLHSASLPIHPLFLPHCSPKNPESNLGSNTMIHLRHTLYIILWYTRKALFRYLICLWLISSKIIIIVADFFLMSCSQTSFKWCMSVFLICSNVWIAPAILSVPYIAHWSTVQHMPSHFYK